MDPFLGWLSEPSSQHKYLYVGADPVNWRDPSGLLELAEQHVIRAFEAQALVAVEFIAIADECVINMLGDWIATQQVDTFTVLDCAVQLAFHGLSTFGGGRRGARNVEEVGGGNECRNCNSLYGECFVAGTKVQTPEGEKNIEDIKAGDEVYALRPTDGEGQEQQVQQVVQTFVRSASAILDIEVEGEIITTTPEHPFWVVGSGWVAAKQLVRGSPLLTNDGRTIRVGDIKRREGEFTVYNFEVAQAHTYFVGGVGVLVHNMCPKRPGGRDWVDASEDNRNWREAKEWAKHDVRQVQDEVREQMEGFESGRHDQYPREMVKRIQDLLDYARRHEFVPEYIDQLLSSQETFRKRAAGGHRGGRTGRGRR